MEYLDDLDEATRRAVREVRDGMGGDMSDGWLDMLRDEAVKHKKNAKPKATATARREKPDDPRMDLLRQAAQKVNNKPRCPRCGRRADRMKAGQCPTCYDRNRSRKYFKVDLSGREEVMSVVEEFARRERRSKADMLMTLAAAEISRRFADLSGPCRKRAKGGGHNQK